MARTTLPPTPESSLSGISKFFCITEPERNDTTKQKSPTMASSASSCSSISPTLNSSPFCPKPFSKFPSPPLLPFSRTLKPSRFPPSKSHAHRNRRGKTTLTPRAQTLDFGSSFFEGGFGLGSEEDDDPVTPPPPLFGVGLLPEEVKEEPPCPPGLQKYESMVVLRPDLSEDERLAATSKYEELLVTGGGMYVEIFNRGVISLAYSIKKKDKDGISNTYMDGIYLLFKFCTKPASIEALETTLRLDDDVIRFTTFKYKKPVYLLSQVDDYEFSY
ncbi:hypothetical protein Tsubulata_013262 [Turnera subulata]|uniref:Uncharacterized protein n=1 Tax=Turnera subulata TaxID=218843 RepID=A0A9Q0FNW0_9ROSI|nr:hypothetical protein Tsubulata_013262 [Turnera subulata]